MDKRIFENQKTVTKTGIKYFRSAKMDPGELKLIRKPNIVLTVSAVPEINDTNINRTFGQWILNRFSYFTYTVLPVGRVHMNELS